MRDDGEQAIFFYSRHPITAEIILAKLRAARGNLDGPRPEDLYPHDQDHYGGLEANDVLATARATSWRRPFPRRASTS
jgi:sarcosine/dimethylglycine N-methyltransferase